jgi:putative transposase
MANTFTQLYIHIVFAVKHRKHLISSDHKEELHKYITGIIRNKGHKLIAINSMPDHIHILAGVKPDIAVSDLVREIKSCSSKFINLQKWNNYRFEWQSGFGAFSVSASQFSRVAEYIENQEKHHAKKKFRDEYTEFLRLYQIEADEKYIFEAVN